MLALFLFTLTLLAFFGILGIRVATWKNAPGLGSVVEGAAEAKRVATEPPKKKPVNPTMAANLAEQLNKSITALSALGRGADSGPTFVWSGKSFDDLAVGGSQVDNEALVKMLQEWAGDRDVTIRSDLPSELGVPDVVFWDLGGVFVAEAKTRFDNKYGDVKAALRSLEAKVERLAEDSASKSK